MDSPCNSICTLNDADICVGCGRSIAEIAGWAQFDEQRQRSVIELSRCRLARLGESSPPAPVTGP